MSQDINYALISALYASGTSGLYSDVYFPIIKYTIVQLFNNNVIKDGSQYYSVGDVHDYIFDKFKIHIPNIVIAKSMQKIDATKKDFVELHIMENGNSFQIKRLWDSQEFDQLCERELLFSKGLEQIETDYKMFLVQNGTFDDGVSYLQFISDNTEEVLGYFQKSDSTMIDEKYATVIFFLEYLHNTPSKKEEFYVADQLFWASIIAGYLKSEKPPVDAADDGCKKEYYLDTSILLGMMKLSSKQKEEYTAEVCEIIKASGGIMRAHPMTLEEIKNILLSVESATQPDPGTDIAEAWENHKLTINNIAKTRLNLGAILPKLGVQVFPLMGPEECRNRARAYSGKKSVAALAAERSKKPSSYSQDNFREIHDLFMDDYIKERRKAKNGSEDIVFVTSNRDLITFTKNMHPEQCYMVSTSRLILELWMHNVKPADISSCALTETMARCLDQHNMRVRNKLMEVSKFFNANKGNFDAQVYQDFIKKLYQRARNVIMAVEANPDDQDSFGELTAQRILDAMKADQEYYDKKIKEKETENAELLIKLSNETSSKEALNQVNSDQKAHIENLTREKYNLVDQVSDVSKKLTLSEQKVKAEATARKDAEAKVALYMRRDKLRNDLENVEAELAPLETERERSFCNRKPKWLIGIGISLILCTVVIIVFGIALEKYWMLAIGMVPTALGVFFFGRANTLNDRIKERKSAAYEKWESAPENKKYKLLKRQRMEIKNELKEIEEKTHNF